MVRTRKREYLDTTIPEPWILDGLEIPTTTPSPKRKRIETAGAPLPEAPNTLASGYNGDVDDHALSVIDQVTELDERLVHKTCFAGNRVVYNNALNSDIQPLRDELQVSNTFLQAFEPHTKQELHSNIIEILNDEELCGKQSPILQF